MKEYDENEDDHDNVGDTDDEYQSGDSFQPFIIDVANVEQISGKVRAPQKGTIKVDLPNDEQRSPSSSSLPISYSSQITCILTLFQ